MVPNDVKIYHIVHISKLSAIIAERFLISYAEVKRRPSVGESIGILKIKERWLSLPLTSHPGLNVGYCVPFYFCPRSPMLYMSYKGNSSELEYKGGQEPIVHLVADLRKVVDWANKHKIRWAFTDMNAGTYCFEDYADLSALDKIDWDAVHARYWTMCMDKKYAEFLVERCFPWELFDEIGVYSNYQQQMVREILGKDVSFPIVKVQPEWYY